MIKKLKKALKIYQREGRDVLLRKSRRYFANTPQRIGRYISLSLMDANRFYYSQKTDAYAGYQPSKDSGVFTYQNRSGFDIFNEDWDNLIILDACRYDYFSEYNTIDGNLEHRISKASSTQDFIIGNFTNKHLLDTVYVSANPWYGRYYKDINSDIFNYHLCDQDAFEGEVSHPETVTNKTIEFADRYKNKRLLVHYLQPHYPYFDEDGEEFMGTKQTFCWNLRSHGYSNEDIIEAYTRNLKCVLKSVERLLDHLEGKTIITADHGELLGERHFPIPIRQHKHPRGVWKKELIKIPWLVMDSEERKQIETAEATENWGFTEPEHNDIEEQLQMLGYLE